MASASDVTIVQDGAGNAKLHPYLIALVRWCMSCLWSTASVFLHRLVTAQLLPITASKQASKARQAGTDHLHPEPKVECVVLHTPSTPTLDVIFMHGLYGSLGNTWRQGDWRSKYKLEPTKVPLRNHVPQPCGCQQEQHEQPYTNTSFTYETDLNETEINETVSFQQINGCFKKILPHENSLITEKFYNNTFLNVNNYETQGNFVTELFKNDYSNTMGNKNCDLNINTFKCNLNGNKCNGINKCKCKINKNGKLNECNCEINEEKTNVSKCAVGCGCVCDDCYSSCWPRDWIKEDFPGARVISVNYTSDPYLWRPLWVKGCKRLRLHERAEQMIGQLLDLGVGQRPIIWVGHSKGGLFIKQIYCQAYEAYMKMNKNLNDNKINNNTEDQSNNSADLDNNYNNYEDTNCIHVANELRRKDTNDAMLDNNDNLVLNDKNQMSSNYYLPNGGEYRQHTNNSQQTEDLLNAFRNTEMFGCGDSDFRAINEFLDMSIRNSAESADSETSEERIDSYDVMSSNEEEDIESLQSRSSLWQQSVGFMFYSVPHRGSPLAAIKTPITARSIELLEISKDCQLVLELQARWLRATRPSQPSVRSLVETCRTLMSVLWLRIVSVDSADAGVGSLHGVSVDHREICKPSSRRCLLYTELTGLVRAALARCQCRSP